MIRQVLTAMMLVAVAACDAGTGSNTDSVTPAAVLAPPKDSSQMVTFGGLGPVKIGATAAQLAVALGYAYDGRNNRNTPCRYMRPHAVPNGVSIMLVHDSVARIDVDSAGILTVKGVGVGDTEARVQQLYGSAVQVRPHKYTGPVGHYLVVSPADEGDNRLIFETDGQRVVRYRVGRLPPVEYVEGCS